MASADYHTRAAEEAEKYSQLIRDTAHQLRTDPAYQACFAGYEPASVEHFIQYYANHKAHWLQDGPLHLKWRIEGASEFRAEAYERLWEIQQKKLFDLQERWRAGEIELPGVTIGMQFHGYLERIIHRLDWVPPITAEEVALYRDYLLSDACRDVGHGPDTHHHWAWQDYEDMRALALAPDPDAVFDPRPYPDWYRYYDARTGTQPFQRPNRRGEREAFYRARADREADELKPSTPPDEHDARPWWHQLASDEKRDLFAEFAQRFDPTPNLLALRAAYDEGTGKWKNERVTDGLIMNIDLLLKARERLAIDADADDWRQPLIDLGNQLRKTLLAVALTDVYEEEYLLRRQTGLTLAPPDPDRTIRETEPEWLNEVRQEILRGRELNGEPRDFNY